MLSNPNGGDVVEVSMENSAVRRLADSSTKFVDLGNEAKIASDAEHSMTVREAARLYPKAIFWSLFFSTAVAMEGYDLVLVSSLFAFPTFAHRYGAKASNGSYQISAPWQTGLNNAARVGEILGLLINGWLAERYGFRMTMIGSLVALTGFIFIPFFSQNLPTLLAGDILMGIPWGVFQTLTTSYAVEVCPVVLRPYLTTYVNMMWGLGQLISVGVLRAMLSRTDEWSYRIPFALQWMWPVPLIAGILLAPESPWWLVRKGRPADARAALRALSMNSDDELDTTISMMRYTDEVEKEISVGTSYLDCFRGVNLRRTEIACVAWVIQAACGASLMGNAAYFFQQAGLPTTISFDFTISMYAVAMIGVVISWFVMTRLGRRTIYLCGLSGLVATMLTTGFVSLSASKHAGYGIGSLLLVFTLIYDITIGTVAYSVVAEIPSSRLRTKTVVLARTAYNIQGTINGVISPYMLNPTAWNWQGKAGFFWGCTGLLCLTWSYFRLPEPRGRTFAELDLLFEQNISARKFSSAVVDPFQTQQSVDVEVEDKSPTS